MLSNDLSSTVLTIGCNYKHPKGGVAQVMWNYSKYIFPTFKCVINSDSKNVLINSLICIIALIKTLIILLIDKNIKIVHIHTASYNSFWRSSLFVWLSKKFGKKTLLHIHGGGFKEFYALNPQKISRILNQCDTLIVLSESWKDFFSEVTSAPNIEIVNNIIPYPTIKGELKRSDSGITRFLFLGLITEQKGIFDLISVIATNKEALKGKMVLYVGGNGKVKQLVDFIEQNGISDIVQYKGWISGKDKTEILNLSDVYILPSYTEGLPMSILEAMSYKMVIISTPVGGIPEVVKNGVNGYLIEPGDKISLSNIILDVIAEKNKYKEMKDESYKIALSYFPNNIEKQLVGVYKNMLN